jgi:hypothetical protein
MDKATLIGIALQLIVRDVVSTTEYYRDIPGFRIIDYFLDPPVYAMVERDGFQVHFGKADGDHINKNEQFRKISNDFFIWVPEIDKFFEERKSRNADIIAGIVKRVYGSREFVVRDSDGQ